MYENDLRKQFEQLDLSEILDVQNEISRDVEKGLMEHSMEQTEPFIRQNFPKQKVDGKQRLAVRHTLRYKTPQLQSELTGQISMQELQNHSRRHSLKAVEQTRHWQMRQGYAPLAWRQCRKTRASRCIPSETGKCMASMRIKRARYILLAEPG